MATNVNYTSLVSDVTNYIERGASAISDDTVYAQIPRLINACERKLIQVLKLQGTIEVLVNPVGFVAGVAVVQKPDRWRQTKSFFYGSGSGGNAYTPVFPREYEYCNSYWPNRTLTSPPLFYADYDYQHWLISPTPDQNYGIEVNCYMMPVLLDSNNQNNFWTEYTPNILLYGTLLEATPFLKNDERIPVWQQFYDREIQTLIPQDLQKILDANASRTRP